VFWLLNHLLGHCNSFAEDELTTSEGDLPPYRSGRLSFCNVVKKYNLVKLTYLIL